MGSSQGKRQGQSADHGACAGKFLQSVQHAGGLRERGGAF